MMCCAKDFLPFLNAAYTKKDKHQEFESRVSAWISISKYSKELLCSK